MRDVLVELLVFLVGDLIPRPRPQRLHRVDGLGFDGYDVLAALFRGRRAPLDPHPDGPGDEVRVPLDQFGDLLRRGVVVQLVLGVHRLEMQRHRRPLRSVIERFDRVGALAAGLPPGGFTLAGFARKQLDPIGDHEGRVEADAELADQLLRSSGVLGFEQLLPQLGSTRFGDGSDQIHHLLMRHPDAVVAHGQRAGVGVQLDLDVQIGGVDVEFLVPEGLEPKLVQGVGGVGDQLPQK